MAVINLKNYYLRKGIISEYIKHGKVVVRWNAMVEWKLARVTERERANKGMTLCNGELLVIK